MRVIEIAMCFIFKDLMAARHEDPMTLYDDAGKMMVITIPLVFKGNDDSDADDDVLGSFSACPA
jgi:hypothetical protein